MDNKPIFGPTNEDPAGSFKLLSSCFMISLVRVNFEMFQDREKDSPYFCLRVAYPPTSSPIRSRRRAASDVVMILCHFR